jgi:hypothetical protein
MQVLTTNLWTSDFIPVVLNLPSRKPRIRPSRWPRGTLYPQKLAVTSPTSGGRSVGVVRSRTQPTVFVFIFQPLWGRGLVNSFLIRRGSAPKKYSTGQGPCVLFIQSLVFSLILTRESIKKAKQRHKKIHLYIAKFKGMETKERKKYELHTRSSSVRVQCE